jgi:hypothetical protein
MIGGEVKAKAGVATCRSKPGGRNFAKDDCFQLGVGEEHFSAKKFFGGPIQSAGPLFKAPVI